MKVLDFGLAKVAAPQPVPEAGATRIMNETREGTIMGTFAYISPEQAEGKKLDFHSDIFSFGAVLYEVATGRRAVQRDLHASLIAAVLRDQPPPPREIRRELAGPPADHA